jgi:hypothetical protein
MGGYGALLLAADEGPEDFQAHQVFARAEDLKGVALRIDCGRDDPFAGAVRDLRAQVIAVGGLQAGAHTAGYWRRLLPDQLHFLGNELSG